MGKACSSVTAHSSSLWPLHKGDRIYAEGRLKLKPKAPPGGEQETIQN